MKNFIFICFILSILFKTGNVLSDNNIFNVNNIKINAENSKNKEKLVNRAFQEGFNKLIKRLLLEDDYKKIVNINLNEIKNFISYYQILNPEKKDKQQRNTTVNIFFDKDRLHKFFYSKNILYSDIINTEVILFPLLKKDNQYFIYSGNHFYENWNSLEIDNLIQYTLPVENIENIQMINSNKENIYKLDISNFFKEYENSNIVFAYIDIDDNELNRLGIPDIGVLGDAQLSLTKIIHALPKYNRKRSSRKEELLSIKLNMLKEFEQNIGPQLEILNIIREELPEDGFFVDEVTQVGFSSWYAFPCYRPRHFITSGYQGNLGYGYATALGVKAAHPDKKVISISGDGGFMYQAQELATAVKYGLDVVAIIFNNNLYGNVQNDLELMFEGQSIGAELHNPDFVKFAESFGATGFKVSNPTELRSAIKRAFAESGPTLIEMTVGKMPRPWPYINLPKCRG